MRFNLLTDSIMDINTEDLLEYLQYLTKAAYLSDLCCLDYEVIRAHLPEIEVDKYPYSQWLDAATYLTGTKPELATAQEVYDYLLHFQK